ncbi:FAD binding domain-containing protein [Seiridium cupressi]
MAEDKTQNFRAIVVGGGPVALTAAHALSKAGIDYIILERRKALDVDSGASVAVWPHNVRLLDQLGLLEEAERTYMPVHNKRNVRRDGTELSRSNMFEAIGINHGHAWMCFHRAKLMNMLYQRLPDQSKVLLDKEVVSLENTATGVTVTCADKSTYSASIVIGADGVHSSVRRLMNEASGEDDDPFIASYRGLYGYAKRSPELEPATLYETHSGNLTIQLIVAEGQQHFLIYERLPKPTRERTRYTPEDAENLAKKYADVRYPSNKAGEWVTFGDIWAQKQWATLANLEEGIVKNWHQGRVVLVGDAVHKMTPNTGFGMNSGLQGVAQLVNKLHSLLQKTPNPDVDTLDRVFGEYQTARMSNSKEAVDVSGLYTRLVAWNNPVWRFTDQYLLPFVKADNTSLDLLMSPIVQKGVPLDFLEEKNFKHGRYAYHTGPATASA